MVRIYSSSISIKPAAIKSLHSDCLYLYQPKLSHHHDQNLFLSSKIHGLLYPEFYKGEYDLLLDRTTIQTLGLE